MERGTLCGRWRVNGNTSSNDSLAPPFRRSEHAGTFLKADDLLGLQVKSQRADTGRQVRPFGVDSIRQKEAWISTSGNLTSHMAPPWHQVSALRMVSIGVSWNVCA